LKKWLEKLKKVFEIINLIPGYQITLVGENDLFNEQWWIKHLRVLRDDEKLILITLLLHIDSLRMLIRMEWIIVIDVFLII
jgi:hypothetical protein